MVVDFTWEADLYESARGPLVGTSLVKKLSFASEGILALHIVEFASQPHPVHRVKEVCNFEAKMARSMWPIRLTILTVLS